MEVFAKKFMFPVSYCEHATADELCTSVALLLREATHSSTLFHDQAPLPRQGLLRLWCNQTCDQLICQSVHALVPPNSCCHEPIVLDILELACEQNVNNSPQTESDTDITLLADQERVAMVEHDHDVCLVPCRNHRSDVLILVCAGTSTEDVHVRYAKAKTVKKDRLVPYISLDDRRQIFSNVHLAYISSAQVRGRGPNILSS